jgi:hypothetical protein
MHITNKENVGMEILVSKSLENLHLGYGFDVDLNKVCVMLKDNKRRFKK